MRRVLTRAATAALVICSVSVCPAAPGTAAPPATAQVFALVGGTLSLTAAASSSLGSTASSLGGSTIAGTLGSTRVSDDRFTLIAGAWSVTASLTNFSRTGGGASIAKANASVWSGAATGTAGIVIFVPTTSLTPVSMASSGTIGSATGVLLATSVTYNPSMRVTVPGNTPAGAYTATFTQTAA